MFVVRFFVHLKPDNVEEFKSASMEPHRAIKDHNIFPDENGWL